MYRIINVVDENEYILHDQRDQNLMVIEPVLTLTLNKTGTLEFKIPEEHMYYGTLKKLKSAIRVIEDGEPIYEGRIIIDEFDFYNTRSITCEGCLAFLLDTVQRPFKISGKSPREFLEEVVKSHNSQVEERKRFVVGRVNVEDTDGSVERENQSIRRTWDVIEEHLLDMVGGYLWLSYEGGKKALNYTWDYGGYNEQEIRFGRNLLDLSKYQDATNIFTRVIPAGAEIKYKDALGETQTRVVDIASVNGEKDYMDADKAAIDEFGIITTTLNWPTITDPEKLKMKAAAYLKESIQIPDILKISAVDLNYAGINIQRFKLGRYTKAISRQHHLEKELLLSQLELYLDNPQKGSISLGGTQVTLTGSISSQNANLSKTVQKVAENASKEINRKVENATNLITGGLGGYFVIDDIDPATGKKTHPWRILIMNTPDKATAVNVIQMNQNGIGFSTTGINGPYRNAWTIDGNLVADFITTGTMLCDRLRGGTLELGGSGLGKDGAIRILSSTDKPIGTIDKNGVIFRDGQYIGGTIDIGHGLLYAADGEASLGDYRVSADGTNILESINGFVKFDCRAAEANWPIGDYAILHLGGDGSKGIDFNGGTGEIVCGNTRCGDIIFKDDSWTQGMTTLQMLKQIYDRLDQLKNNADYDWN